MNEQREHHAYDKDGIYQGIIIATDKQFAETGLVEGPEPEPVVTVDDVNAEAKRRIHALIGAKNNQESNEKEANLQIEYMECLDVGLSGETLTDEQEARRAKIKGGNDYIKAIRGFSNALTAKDPIPADYADDKWWS